MWSLEDMEPDEHTGLDFRIFFGAGEVTYEIKITEWASYLGRIVTVELYPPRPIMKVVLSHSVLDRSS